jgi:hypothetical protein
MNTLIKNNMVTLSTNFSSTNINAKLLESDVMTVIRTTVTLLCGMRKDKFVRVRIKDYDTRKLVLVGCVRLFKILKKMICVFVVVCVCSTKAILCLFTIIEIYFF